MFINHDIEAHVNRYHAWRAAQRNAAREAAQDNARKIMAGDDSDNTDKADTTKKTNNPLFCGVDIGQMQDYSAIALAEIEQRPDPDDDGVMKNHFIFRLIERIPLKTEYSQVVARCKQINDKLGGRVRFIVDASGSRPITDLFRAQGVPILPIQITAGSDSRIEHGYGYVSKLNLATLLQVTASDKRLHLPKHSKFSKAILEEARRFELKITDAGNLTFAGEGSSKDDLLMACCYVLWAGENRKLSANRQRVRWV